VLDFGDRVLFFYGQLTNLRFTISVRDTRTGVTKTYQNTAGDCGGLDNNLATASRDPRRPVPADSDPRPCSSSASCQSSANAVCLVNNRFRLELDWREPVRLDQRPRRRARSSPTSPQPSPSPTRRISRCW
jgi:hypothetical protein